MSEPCDLGTIEFDWQPGDPLASREEFDSGHRAARVLEVVGSPWSRAQFLTIREAFREEWQPRGGIEDSMIHVGPGIHAVRILADDVDGTVLGHIRPRLRTYSTWSPPEQDFPAGTWNDIYPTGGAGFVVEYEQPASPDQCKKGGWQQYAVFKNQGDCVSWVATNGKNEPGKNLP